MQEDEHKGKNHLMVDENALVEWANIVYIQIEKAK